MIREAAPPLLLRGVWLFFWGGVYNQETTLSVLNAPWLLVDDDFAGTFNKTGVTCDPSAKPLFSRCLRDSNLECLNIEGRSQV